MTHVHISIRILEALADGEQSQVALRERGLARSAISRDLRALHAKGLLHIARWEGRIAFYRWGQGEDAQRQTVQRPKAEVQQPQDISRIPNSVFALGAMSA